MKDFTSQLPDYLKDLRVRFKTWAASSLPGTLTAITYFIMYSCVYPEKSTSTTISSAPSDARSLITVTLDEEKFPRLILPDDMDAVTVKMVKSGLMDYMNAAWGTSLLSLPAGRSLANHFGRACVTAWISDPSSLVVSQVSTRKLLRKSRSTGYVSEHAA
jgi:hypothetical protein